MADRLSKQEARIWGKDQRKQIAEAGTIVGWQNFQNELLFHSLDLSGITWVHVFLPMQNQIEPDLWPLLSKWKEKYPQLKFAAPVSDFGQYSFQQYELLLDSMPALSSKGIPEPKEDPDKLVLPTATDLAFIPLLAADIYGNRVGYGAGFYDRFLANSRIDCVKIGLALYPPIEGEIANEAHDIKLDYYASATEIIEIRP
jgi:5-formyltetrahydrofolate cyclo-ligase